jgi:NTP pyrophosphatase (non-canonical NTP hydrolase)
LITADEYQRKTYGFDNHVIEDNAIATVMGLTAEAGEVANEYERSLRGYGGPVDKAKVALELGDVLWNVARLAEILGYTLTEIMEMNLAKLEKRYADRNLSLNEV